MNDYNNKLAQTTGTAILVHTDNSPSILIINYSCIRVSVLITLIVVQWAY